MRISQLLSLISDNKSNAANNNAKNTFFSTIIFLLYYYTFENPIATIKISGIGENVIYACHSCE